jgi:UDP-N-acetyl-D-mannosaminuronic acid dehydrogenase
VDHDRVLVVGGGGHIGLPLSLFLANSGMKVSIFDVSSETVDLIRAKVMPFQESGCDALLTAAIDSENLEAFTNFNSSSQKDWPIAIVIIGTQLLENGEPDRQGVLNCIKEIHTKLSDGALLILRSTVFPGTTDLVQSSLYDQGRDDIKVVFAPERIAEGHALIELSTLPQIIGAEDDASFEAANTFFEKLGNSVLRTTSKEAEIAKLITNAYRYAHFALGNAIYIATQDHNIDYSTLYKVMIHDYPRLKSLPKPGFVGGPCLIKDTVQLQSFFRGSELMTEFSLRVNHGLITLVKNKVMEMAKDTSFNKIGVLGIGFKPDTDDTRDSQILILMKDLVALGFDVSYFDPYSKSGEYKFQNLEELIDNSDILVMGTPHKTFTNLKLDKPIVNVWI